MAQIIECPICMTDLLDCNIVVLSCRHKYHYSCLREWNKVSDSCPYCRKLLIDENAPNS